MAEPSNFHDENSVRLYDLIHNKTAVPVCRVHVYKRISITPATPGEISDEALAKNWKDSAKLPVSWATPPKKKVNVPKEANVSPADNPSQKPIEPKQDPVTPSLILGREGMYLSTDWNPALSPADLKNVSAMPWQVLSCRVNQTRQWSCSSCNIQIAAPFDNTFNLAKMTPPIAPNDVIVVELGYIKSLRTKVALESGNTNYNNFAGDVVFYGIVDTVKERGGSGEGDGVILTVLARDAMSLLVDNKIRGQYTPQTLERFNRAYVIRDLLWRGAAIEYVEFVPKDTADGLPGNKEIVGRRTALVNDNTGTVVPADFGPTNCSIRVGNIELSNRLDIPPNMTNKPESSIVLMDRFPLDVIKHFSLVETAPRELWADQRTGEIHWMFRRSDIRRLISAKTRPCRQYFYRFPAERANILSYTAEWSTAGTITHFTMTNPLSHVGDTKKVADIYTEGKQADLVDPHTNKKLRPIIRNRFIYDDTLVNIDEAAVIADALFYIWGRTIETGMIMILGDPSLEISEGVQIFNTGLFGRRLRPGDEEESKFIYEEKNLLESEKQTIPNPRGVYRVEAITHMFATGGIQQGYKTVFVFGPLDDNAGDPKRLITDDKDLDTIKLIETDNPSSYGQASS